MRLVSTIAFVLVLLAPVGAATAQAYDEAAIEAHLREMYSDYGGRILKWKGPVYYVVAGFDSLETIRLVENQFAYLGELTGLDIRNAATAGHPGNFILVFADPFVSLSEQKGIRSVFGEEGQTDAEHHAMLAEMDSQRLSRSIMKRTADAIAFYAHLTNPTEWESDLVITRILQLIVHGLTHTGMSNEIEPSILNAGATQRPLSRLPSIDEAYLRNLYSDFLRSGVPLEQGISHLAAAIAFDLNS